MNIHEYQAKRIISQYGINIPKGRIAYTPLEAKNAALAVAYRGPWMLKAQIQSGARNHGRFLEKSAGAAAVSAWSNTAARLWKKPAKCSAQRW